MFDIGWTEMALIAVVAVIVIGPKELPKVMRELGTWVARARGMSRIFMEQLEEMSRQSGIDEVRKEAEALRRLDPARQIEKTIDPEGVIARQTSDIGQISGGQNGAPSEPSLPKPADPTPADPTSNAETPSLTPPAEPPAAQTSDPAQPTPDAPAREPGESKP
jgi:sec-independent protein translocase protein TatB